MDKREGLNASLKKHFKLLTDSGKIHGARYQIAIKNRIVAEGVVGKTDSMVDTQSITKFFTTVAILQLIDKGILKPEDYAASYLPEFQKAPFAQIKLIHLLTHTSGLAALQDTFPERDLDWEADVDRKHVKETWIPAILKKGLFYEPGTQWEYSKAGFCILGEMIGRITGQTAEQYIRDNILLPCEMYNSHWNTQMDSMWKEIPKTTWGLMTPINELVQFGRMIADGGSYNGKRIVSENVLELLERNWLPKDMKDYCWDHGGKPVAYGAGCPVYISGYEKQWTVDEGTIYHEGAGASMLLVNRKRHLAAAWATPFVDTNTWCEDAVKGTANVLWKYIDRLEI